MRSQAGVTLVEVLISALLVSVIAIGTFTAFDTAGRASQDQRTHALAGQLAQQDEEHLRGLTQSELTTLTNTTLIAQPVAENGLCLKEVAGGKWEYTTTPAQATYNNCNATSFAGEKYTGTVFLVTTSARFVSASTNSIACETAGTTTDYIQTSSSVRWATLQSQRPAVTQSNLVNDSVTGLLVKVFNQNHEPESGVAVTVTGTSPTFSSSQTTPPAGCVLVSGITNSSVKVAVAKTNFVNFAGKPPAEESVPIVPGKSATKEFIIGKSGEIEATFVSENPVTKKVEQAEGETFFAGQSSITPPPLNFIGGANNAPHEKATVGPVFPFAQPAVPHEPEAYTVYAGDCNKNEPAGALLTAGNKALVSPGGVGKATLEVPTITATIFKHTKALVEAGKTEKLTSAVSAEVINSECPAVPSAQNTGTFTNKHKVTVTATGGISPPWQPYAKTLELCIVGEVAASKFYRSVTTFKNEAKAGTTVPVYMESGTAKAKASELTACT